MDWTGEVVITVKCACGAEFALAEVVARGLIVFTESECTLPNARLHCIDDFAMICSICGDVHQSGRSRFTSGLEAGDVGRAFMLQHNQCRMQ